MKFEVRLFARARDAAGADRVFLDLPETSRVSDLRTALVSQCPALAPLASRLLVAVGNDYADEETVLDPRAEVACFPPVSGG